MIIRRNQFGDAVIRCHIADDRDVVGKPLDFLIILLIDREEQFVVLSPIQGGDTGDDLEIFGQFRGGRIQRNLVFIQLATYA